MKVLKFNDLSKVKANWSKG